MAIELKQYLDSEGLRQWHQLVDSAQHIVIIGHHGPDGDAMGSSLGLCHLFRSLGKTDVQVVMPSLFPDFLKWLPGASDVLLYEYRRAATKTVLAKCDLLMCLDFNSLGRLEELAGPVEYCQAPRILIDHHLDPEPIAELVISDPPASSTSEIVFDLIWQLGYFPALTRDAAACIYCGMMTDTGGFTYNSSRPEIYFIISQLLTKGIDKDKIYRAVYNNYSESRMRLLGYILNEKMEYFPQRHASIFTLTKEEMTRFSFKKGDAEGIVNMPLQIQGTRLSISLREDTEKPLIRVSLRSVDDFPCNKMAEQFFNGGGHLNASGGSLKMTIEQARQQALKALEAYKDLLSDTPAK